MYIGFYIFAIPCLVFLGVFIFVQNKHKHVLATIFKGLASICFFLFAFYQLFYLTNQKSLTINIGYTIEIFIGLGFGVIGDVLLNLRDLFKKPVKDYISLGGVVAFFIGHLFYVIHLFRIISFKECSFISASYLFIPFIIAIIVASFLSFLVFKLLDKKKEMKIIATVYIAMISLLSSLACFNMVAALNASPAINENFAYYFIVIFLGCLLFALSDVILIFNSFGKHPRPAVSAINLLVYYSAQILIGFSIYFFYLGIM